MKTLTEIELVSILGGSDSIPNPWAEEVPPEDWGTVMAANLPSPAPDLTGVWANENGHAE